MKNMILILALSGLAVLTGCEKKTEPAADTAMDMSQTAKETSEQAKPDAAEAKKTSETSAAVATEQTQCPVLANNPIDRDVFVEYKGKKVYFCCQACVAEFNKNPEKYISQLPQFKQ